MPIPRDKRLFREAKRSLLECLCRIRQSTPKAQFDHNTYGEVDMRIGHLDGVAVKRAVITLRGHGCDWTIIGGGCTMCGHFAGMAQDDSVSADELVNQFENGLSDSNLSEDVPILCIYNGGNFFNEREIPISAQQDICDRIGELPYVKKVVFETKLDYCREEELIDLKHRLQGKELVIATGLESIDDGIRELSINKGMILQAFERKVEQIKRIASIRIYLLLGSPFLTEAEAVIDTIESIKFVNRLGVEAIHIEPLTVQKFTLAAHLWQTRQFRPPWLWSIIEVLKRTDPIPIYVSPFAHYPRPFAVPENCPMCSQRVRVAILEKYNQNYDRRSFSQLSCECKTQWEEEMSVIDGNPLEKRVLAETRKMLGVLAKSQSIQADLLSLHERRISTKNK